MSGYAIELNRRRKIRCPVPLRRFRPFLTRLLELLEQPVGTGLSLLLTDDREIHRLNLQWRGKDRPTDVLSFSLREGRGSRFFHQGPLGDIVLSLPMVERQAVEKGWSLEEELAFLTLHGVLHLLGYDHERDEDHVVMEAKTSTIWARLHPEVMPLLGGR